MDTASINHQPAARLQQELHVLIVHYDPGATVHRAFWLIVKLTYHKKLTETSEQLSTANAIGKQHRHTVKLFCCSVLCVPFAPPDHHYGKKRIQPNGIVCRNGTRQEDDNGIIQRAPIPVVKNVSGTGLVPETIALPLKTARNPSRTPGTILTDYLPAANETPAAFHKNRAGGTPNIPPPPSSAWQGKGKKVSDEDGQSVNVSTVSVAINYRACVTYDGRVGVPFIVLVRSGYHPNRLTSGQCRVSSLNECMSGFSSASGFAVSR
uniref:Uncharacterized protein n=1 Tax=Anopheles coluzzii TaxID=1518534 RepID=A0A8W7P1X8_ANOCL